MWARIENGTVAEITDIDPSGRFNPSLIWVPCPVGTVVGELYNSITGGFSIAPIISTPLKIQAQNSLAETDMVAWRCFKAGVAFPSAWQTYTTALRAIANGADTVSTILPIKPTYPTGT